MLKVSIENGYRGIDAAYARVHVEAYEAIESPRFGS